MKLFTELKRRKVFRVGAAYLVVAWLAVQVTSTLLPMFDVPAWANRAVVILLAIGFVPAVVFAWMFEWTPQGLRRELPQPPAPALPVEATGTVPVLANATVGTATQAAASANVAPAPTPVVSGTRVDSIAVLPFELHNSDAETAYLSDGLGESLIYRLSRLSGLKVCPTSSVRRFRATSIDPLQAGRELGVAAVMTGRFSQRGDALIVSVELLDVRGERLLWGERYDRKLADLLATQREIAAEIVQNLQPELSAPDRANLGKQYTTSNEAYQLYLKGRHLYDRRTKDAIDGAIECFRAAIAIDPAFALAYVATADCWNSMSAFSYLSAREAHPRAFAAARRALELDPALGEAHGAIAFTLATHDWNWVEAEREFRRALELSPFDTQSRVRYGISLLVPTRRAPQAVAEIERAFALEPQALMIGTQLTLAYIYTRQADRALEHALRIRALDPAFVPGSLFLGFAYLANAMYEQAIELARSEPAQSPMRPFMLIVSGIACARLNRRAEAEADMATYAELARSGGATSYYLAAMHAALGNRDAGIAALETALEERDFFVGRLTVDPFLDSLRDDPRYAGLVRRMGLPP